MYEVRVFDKKGKLKRIISPKQLMAIHWKKFREDEDKRRKPINLGKKVSTLVHPDLVLIEWELERGNGEELN